MVSFCYSVQAQHIGYPIRYLIELPVRHLPLRITKSRIIGMITKSLIKFFHNGMAVFITEIFSGRFHRIPSGQTLFF